MTITTAERASAGARNALRLAPLALAAMFVSAECRADWKFVPQMDLRETYSDNATLMNDQQARSSWISEAIPALSVSEDSEHLKLRAQGQWHAYAYSQKDLPNARESDRLYNASAQAKVIDNLFYVDASANSSRQAVSAFGTLNSPFSSLNTSQISSWNISPYLQHRFGTSADLLVRYARDSVQGDANAFGNSMASTRSASLTSGSAFNDVAWGLSYNHQDLNGQYSGATSSENDLANVRWNLVRRFGLTASVGYDSYDYPTLNERTAGRSWSTGFAWTPSTRTSVQASFGRRYFGKTGSLASSYRTPHTIWTLNYSDEITTSRSQFLLPATVDTAAMLDSLLAASYPDPVQRQQAVQAYIASAGLPPTLATSINYLSNRYIRDKRLQGAATLRGGRSTLVLAVYRDQRTALSLPGSDSNVPGALSGLDDNVRQRGANANFEYRLSARTSALGSLSVNRVLSLTTGDTTTYLDQRIGLSRRFDAKTRGSLELRHTNSRVGVLDNAATHENAIAATLSVLY